MLERFGGVAAAVGLGGAAVLIGPNVMSLPLSAHAELTLLSASDVLSSSDHAMFVGGTFEPTPSVAWVNDAEKFLDPLGFAGPAASASTICDMSGTSPCDAPLQVLTTPELLEEGPSTAITTTDIVKAVEAEYDAGNMSASDPLTIFTYSQSAMAMSDAEAQLSAYGIPAADLRLVMIGDPSDANGVATNIYNDLVTLFGGGTAGTNTTNALLYMVNEGHYAPAGTTYQGHPLIGAGTENGVTPNDLYNTTVYTLTDTTPGGTASDGVADWQVDWNNALAANNGNAWSALGSALYAFVTTHVEYLGLTPTEIADQTSSVDGMTTTIDIANPTNWTSAWAAGLGDIMGTGGFWTSIQESLQDIFDPAYA